ncbi:MAG: hypothetical protein P9M03_11740, partial [Candidatus Theseobacter exili]|nr:hypothetical protein [Candidatus Theseobacter exili]
MQFYKKLTIYLLIHIVCILACPGISFSDADNEESNVDFDEIYRKFKKEIIKKSVFPKNNIWNTPVDKLPIHPESDLFIKAIGERDRLIPDFGEDWETGIAGIPYMVVTSSHPKVQVTFANDFESDPGPYPIPKDIPVEGGPDSHGKRRVIVIDKDNWILYEMSNSWLQGTDNWYAETGAVFDLKSNDLRPIGWTSADAAGLPVFPGLVRYEEVESGEINHALRFTARQITASFVWPSRHFNSGEKNDIFPPMGQYFRLKANFPIARFSPKAQVILTALKKYGMMLADNGDNWSLSGVFDERWDENLIRELQQIKGYNFEAVDASSLITNQNSGSVKKGDAVVGITAPFDLSANAISATKIILRWKISSDSNKIIKYKIYRDGTYIAETIDQKYTDKKLQESTEYTYAVTSCDSEENESDHSVSISVETPAPPDTTPPDSPKRLTAEVISHSQINLIWVGAKDNVKIEGYKILRNGKTIDSTKNTTYSDTSLEGSTEYSFTLIAFDEAGNESEPS